MTVNARKLCADALFSVYKSSSYLSEVLAVIRRKYDISPADMRFVNELTHGVLKYKIRIDYIISKTSDIRLKKISDYVLCVLETAVYQILFMDRVPNEAAVDEAVKLIKNSRQNKAAGFVNAVLRRIAENGGNVIYPDDELENFSTYCSIPLWLAKRWSDRLGMNNAKALAKAMLGKSELTLRCNLLKTTPSNLITGLKESGIEARLYNNPASKIDYVLECSNMNNLDKIPQYQSGEFYVQDFAASLTVEVLSPESGETVIDMCAAPGGKTTHIAEKMGNIGRVLAFDMHEHKISRISENAERLGIDIVYPAVGDGTVFNEKLRNIADRVLVDAPCSGLGVLRKKPDIKYFRKEEDIGCLAEIGARILENAAEYLKPGGLLVYSTCTVEPEENEYAVEAFLKKHCKFSLEPIEEYNKPNNGTLTLYPHTDGCDGFFICKLRKSP